MTHNSPSTEELGTFLEQLCTNLTPSISNLKVIATTLARTVRDDISDPYVPDSSYNHDTCLTNQFHMSGKAATEKIQWECDFSDSGIKMEVFAFGGYKIWSVYWEIPASSHYGQFFRKCRQEMDAPEDALQEYLQQQEMERE